MKDKRLAVLIDADNVPHANVKETLEEIAKNGTPTIKRIYVTGQNQQYQAGKMYCSKMPLPPFSNTATLPEKIPAIVL